MNLENKIKQFEERLSRLEAGRDHDVSAMDGHVQSFGGLSRTERLELAVEHLRTRIDQIGARIDAINGRYENRDLYWERHIHRIEEELRELPRLIENGLRAVLNEPDEPE